MNWTIVHTKATICVGFSVSALYCVGINWPQYKYMLYYLLLHIKRVLSDLNKLLNLSNFQTFTYAS